MTSPEFLQGVIGGKRGQKTLCCGSHHIGRGPIGRYTDHCRGGSTVLGADAFRRCDGYVFCPRPSLRPLGSAGNRHRRRFRRTVHRYFRIWSDRTNTSRSEYLRAHRRRANTGDGYYGVLDRWSSGWGRVVTSILRPTQPWRHRRAANISWLDAWRKNYLAGNSGSCFRWSDDSLRYIRFWSRFLRVNASTYLELTTRTGDGRLLSSPGRPHRLLLRNFHSDCVTRADHISPPLRRIATGLPADQAEVIKGARPEAAIGDVGTVAGWAGVRVPGSPWTNVLSRRRSMPVSTSPCFESPWARGRFETVTVTRSKAYCPDSRPRLQKILNYSH